jgi:hypothetical protein
MALSAKHEERERPPIRLSVEIPSEILKIVLRLLEENGVPPTLEEIAAELMQATRSTFRERLANASPEQREEMDRFLREAEFKLLIVERSIETSGDPLERARELLKDVDLMNAEELQRARELLQQEEIPQWTLFALKDTPSVSDEALRWGERRLQELRESGELP